MGITTESKRLTKELKVVVHTSPNETQIKEIKVTAGKVIGPVCGRGYYWLLNKDRDIHIEREWIS